jgi:hypothetical protein
MGLGYHCVEAIIREHKYRSITGDVVLIGRQTVYFTPQEILQLLHQHDVNTGSLVAADIEVDRSTVERHPGFSDRDQIADAALFKLLGVPKISALDHSDYEGAEIVHDLTKPIPNHLRECADFIVDGSTLDNVFDPAIVLRNLAGMLRPGGRLITTNVFSNDYEPYAIMPPLWFLDYFVANGFADCRVYIIVLPWQSGSTPPSWTTISGTDVFTFNNDMLLDPQQAVSAFSAPRMMMTVVFAEKGSQSTSDITPTQQHYRSAADWIKYRENLRSMQKSSRPHLIRTLGDISFFDVRAGHLFVASDFTARDPWTEIQALDRSPATQDS